MLFRSVLGTGDRSAFGSEAATGSARVLPLPVRPAAAKPVVAARRGSRAAGPRRAGAGAEVVVAKPAADQWKEF